MKFYVQANCVGFVTLTDPFGDLQQAIDFARKILEKWEPRVVDEEGEIRWNWE